LKSWAPFSVATLAALSKICELWGGLILSLLVSSYLLECFNMKSQTINTMAQWGALIAIAAASLYFILNLHQKLNAADQSLFCRLPPFNSTWIPPVAAGQSRLAIIFRDYAKHWRSR